MCDQTHDSHIRAFCVSAGRYAAGGCSCNSGYVGAACQVKHTRALISILFRSCRGQTASSLLELILRLVLVAMCVVQFSNALTCNSRKRTLRTLPQLLPVPIALTDSALTDISTMMCQIRAGWLTPFVSHAFADGLAQSNGACICTVQFAGTSCNTCYINYWSCETLIPAPVFARSCNCASLSFLCACSHLSA
jgi:hypothetical protein